MITLATARSVARAALTRIRSQRKAHAVVLRRGEEQPVMSITKEGLAQHGVGKLLGKVWTWKARHELSVFICRQIIYHLVDKCQ